VVDAAAGLAYVASPEFGLSVVNVATPSQPVVLGAASLPFFGQRVAVSGTLAAVSAGGQGLWIVDVSVPSSPQTRGTVSGSFAGVARSGQYAYALQVIAGNPARTDLVCVNLSNPL